MVTVVPVSASEAISKSSMRRRAPGSPRPRPPRAAVVVAQRRLDVTDPRALVARRHDEAVAVAVLERLEDDLATAGVHHDVARDLRDRCRDQGRIGPREAQPLRHRPRLGAGGHEIGIAGDGHADLIRHLRRPPGHAIEQLLRRVEVERHPQRLQVQAELHHRDRDVGLNAHDDGVGAAQPSGEDDRAQRARDERVDHVERGDVDHDPARAMSSHQLGELVAQRRPPRCRRGPTGRRR